MRKVRSGLLACCGVLLLAGCSPQEASKPPAPATHEVIDLKVGTIQLPPGFSERRTGTIDSRRGEISRDSAPFVIGYDIGFSAGWHMHPQKKDACLWFKEEVTADRRYYIGMEEKGADKILTISIVPADGVRRNMNPWTYPANFWASVKTDEEIETMTQIALSYLPNSEK